MRNTLPIALVTFAVSGIVGLRPLPGTQPVRFSLIEPGVGDRTQIARASVPVPKGRFPDKARLVLRDQASKTRDAEFSVLTRHPDRSVRRLIVRFPIEIGKGRTQTFVVDLVRKEKQATDAVVKGFSFDEYERRMGISPRGTKTRGSNADQTALVTIRPVCPLDVPPGEIRPERTVRSRFHSAVRDRFVDKHTVLTRVIHAGPDDVMKIVLRLLRLEAGDGFCPPFGNELTVRTPSRIRIVLGPEHETILEGADLGKPVSFPLTDAQQAGVELQYPDRQPVSIVLPDAANQRRGRISIATSDGNHVKLTCLRADPDGGEKIIMQEGAYRTARLFIARGPLEKLFRRIEQPLRVRIDPKLYEAVYALAPYVEPTDPRLRALNELHVRWLANCQLRGDDYGNMTNWSPGSSSAGVNGMNRLNHAEYLFQHAWLTGDRRTRQLAIDWALNFVDLSIYWGTKNEHYGGTRYNNLEAMGGKRKIPRGDRPFMVRSNTSVSFCTKGYHTLYMAYEETGIPHLREAALAQAKWAMKNLHADTGECRNIGGVTDFVRMYEYTGDQRYLEHAKRLFIELLNRTTPELLFTQGGKPPTGDDLFIPNDQRGYKTPFIKSYITQYATNALPLLFKHAPETVKLRETILANNDWMARVQDLSGGWAYPHPASQGLMLGHAAEFAHGLMYAHAIEPKDEYLDAIERVLRTRVRLFVKHGKIAAGVTPFEYVHGLAKSPDDLAKMYTQASDRPRQRDWTEGRITFGATPDALVYWFRLLSYYLHHRPAERLFAEDPVLKKLLALPTN